MPKTGTPITLTLDAGLLADAMDHLWRRFADNRATCDAYDELVRAAKGAGLRAPAGTIAAEQLRKGEF